ncbi:pyruvate/2-oxoglutarate dehydrogenase complex dihydrolipoamide dehydrogenase (E3) component [Streptacidiphilus sp. MAP12-16]|uniref:FAD-dependent oxidoreductase n=1 Tax=Streptacidiphilus sp. MAP12-16 TaxID=3156300 RepID=UPI00351197DA
MVGGECSFWAGIPSKMLLCPGEAVHGAREAAATAEVDVERALARRDFMVPDYSDAGQQRWSATKGIALLRGTGRLAVQVAGVGYIADHIVIATGASPIIPPVPVLSELAGVWTNREVTGLRAVPRRLLVLGGGPVGVEMAQAVRRLGGEVILIAPDRHVMPREPAQLGEALGEVLRRDGVDVVLGVQTVGARHDGGDYVLTLDDGQQLRSSPPGGAQGCTTSAWRRSACARTTTASRSTRTCVPPRTSGWSAMPPAAGC